MKVIERIAVAQSATGPHTGCKNGPCPAFMITDDDNIIVQGYKIDPETKNGLGVDIPTNEDVIVIPRGMIDFIIKQYGKR